MIAARTSLKAPFANVEMSRSYFSKTFNDSNEIWCLKEAEVIRAQTEFSTKAKSLKVVKVTDKLAVTKEKLIQFQKKDSSLSKCMKKEGLLVRNEKESITINGRGLCTALPKR